MIEVTLELKFDSFLVHSKGKSEDVSSQKSARALKLSCQKVGSVRKLTENKPSADFEFLGSASKQEAHGETDQEFDDKLFDYLAAHTTVDASKVNIALGESGYVAAEKGTSSGEIGRLLIPELANQSGLVLELVLKQDEFDAAWELLTQQKVRRILANLACFKLAPGAFVGHGKNLFIAGVLSCSLQFAPND
ncbi:MAG: hypothetical protein HZB95_06755 [Nitrosomonadales bacterium]|nr:hypothetical protein [Nitrosomonadales bacterium]